ncbi:uncharacterized protein [Euphorbia lathyris]|uniref:uncharacterized protein n=1 Tax=Euphorbia lathyris TaxID=212925 RepID=UPI0033137E98
MENSKKRWSVTYTKHIKQKRKVYQDGFLDLHIPTNKAMLFDDCDKLLEIKMLKGEEVVSSGETLTFNGYLVDVGDPDCVVKVEVEAKVKAHHRPIFESNFKGRETPRPTLMRRHNNDAAEKSKTRLNNISPSYKVIREFKKSESLRYGALKSRPETVNNTGVTEWNVLYTTQMTQKAKKYHDGFLKLKNGGALGRRQIMLYDASKNLLNTRFLKKDEIIRSDESVAFDAHLVDIGEPEGDNQVFVDLSTEGNTINIVSQEGIKHEHRNRFEEKKFLVAKGEDACSRGISAADTNKISMTVPQNKSLRGINQILSILQKPIAPGIVIPGCTEKNVIQDVCSPEGLQVSDAEADHSNHRLLPKASIQDDGPSENNINGGSSKGMPILTDAQLSSDGGIENPDQCYNTNGPTDDKMKSSGKHKNERKLDEWPTFDLGF